MSTVVVQALVTRWTKESRGGPGAALRNATPTALSLPAEQTRAGEVRVHGVAFDERTGFEPTSTLTVCNLIEFHRVVPGLELRAEAGTLRVRFIWTYFLGAPRRSHGRAIRLLPGQWCRLIYNGRHGLDRTWAYESTVLNVAYGPVDPSAFLDSEPLETQDHREALW